MKDAVYKKPSHSFSTEGSHLKFHQENPSNYTVVCPCEEDKTCRSVSTRMWRPFSTSVVTQV
jgi:hypothetical protein